MQYLQGKCHPSREHVIKLKKKQSNGYTDNNKHKGMKERQF